MRTCPTKNKEYITTVLRLVEGHLIVDVRLTPVPRYLSSRMVWSNSRSLSPERSLDEVHTTLAVESDHIDRAGFIMAILSDPYTIETFRYGSDEIRDINEALDGLIEEYNPRKVTITFSEELRHLERNLTR